MYYTFEHQCIKARIEHSYQNKFYCKTLSKLKNGWDGGNPNIRSKVCCTETCYVGSIAVQKQLQSDRFILFSMAST